MTSTLALQNQHHNANPAHAGGTASRTPPTTSGTDAPHTHLASDDDDEMVDDSDSAPPHSEEGAATPRTKLALLEKRLEFNIDDYDEIVDDDDVESVPAPRACMHPPICAARRGRITPAVRSRPPPLLRTHTGAVPLRSPLLRAGAHSCCLPVGVHMTALRSVPFAQSQHGTLCLIHAFNNMLQLPFLRRPDMCPAFPPGQAHEGNYHVHELHRALYTQYISPHLSVVEGYPHMGATDHMAFLTTVSRQPPECPMADCAILTIHPAQREDGTWQDAHHVAAVLLPLRTDAPEWFVLDSCRPNAVFPLQDLRNATSFDADVSYVANNQPRTAQASGLARWTARSEILRHLTARRRHRTHHQQLPIARADGSSRASRHPAASSLGAAKLPPPPAWTGATAPSGAAASPTQVLLCLPCRYTASGTIDRNALLIGCRRGGLHGVEYASYTQEQVGSLPGAPSGRYDFMYRLKVHVSTHSAQVRSRPHCFRREWRRVLHGAHAVVLTHEQSITVQRTALSKASANHTDKHGFVQRRRQQTTAHEWDSADAHRAGPQHLIHTVRPRHRPPTPPTAPRDPSSGPVAVRPSHRPPHWAAHTPSALTMHAAVSTIATTSARSTHATSTPAP